MAIAVIGTNAMRTSDSLPAGIANAHIFSDAFTVSVALVVAVRFRAIIAVPALVASASVCTHAPAVTRARLAGQQSRSASTADWNGAPVALPAWVASAISVKAVSVVGAVVRAIVGVAVASRVPLLAVAGERSNTRTVS